MRKKIENLRNHNFKGNPFGEYLGKSKSEMEHITKKLKEKYINSSIFRDGPKGRCSHELSELAFLIFEEKSLTHQLRTYFFA